MIYTYEKQNVGKGYVMLKLNPEKARVAIFTSEKVDFKENITRNKEGHTIMKTG